LNYALIERVSVFEHDFTVYLLVFSAEGDLKQFTAIADHHVAKHGYNASFFISPNRPQCIQDMYNLCATNPTKVIRSADLYRKDGLSGSKMFKCWPVLMDNPKATKYDHDIPRAVSVCYFIIIPRQKLLKISTKRRLW